MKKSVFVSAFALLLFSVGCQRKAVRVFAPTPVPRTSPATVIHNGKVVIVTGE